MDKKIEWIGTNDRREPRNGRRKGNGCSLWMEGRWRECRVIGDGGLKGGGKGREGSRTMWKRK